jgi:hypothetical protein
LSFLPLASLKVHLPSSLVVFVLMTSVKSCSWVVNLPFVFTLNTAPLFWVLKLNYILSRAK